MTSTLLEYGKLNTRNNMKNKPKFQGVPEGLLETQKQLGYIFVLIDRLSQSLDLTGIKDAKHIRLLKKKSDLLNAAILPLIDQFYKSNGIDKTTFFIEIQKKFDYIVDKAYK